MIPPPRETSPETTPVILPMKWVFEDPQRNKKHRCLSSSQGFMLSTWGVEEEEESRYVHTASKGL